MIQPKQSSKIVILKNTNAFSSIRLRLLQNSASLGARISLNRFLKNQGNHVMSANEIMNMDWLVENVVGEMPAFEELDEEAAAVIEAQGFHLNTSGIQ